MSEIIHVRGLDRLLEKLNKLGRMDYAKKAIKDAGDHVKGKIAEYPPQRHHKMRWKSEKQRRWFFAALRRGTITVPYRRGQGRSEDLGGSWTVEIKDGGLTAVIGNNVSYGPLVQQEGKQYWMHKATGWKTTSKVLQDETAYVNEQVVKAVRDALK